MRKPGMEILVDMSGLDEVIGVGFAIGSIGRQSRYMKNLIRAAFYESDTEFNRQMAAFAAASGRLGHMYEWGTIGINTTESNMSLDPMDKYARLWTNQIIIGNSHANVTYIFNPSVAVVPKPPSEKTGIAQNVLNRLKDHIFWNKAFVMETGVQVTITPKSDNERGLLFVPNIWKGEEGYSMYSRPTNPDISSKTKGTFTSLWEAYWGGEGPVKMDADIGRWFEEDVYRAYKSIKSRQKYRRPADYSDEIIRYKAETVRKDFERASAARLAEKAGRNAD